MLNSQQIYSHLRVFIEGVNNLLHIGTEGIVNLTRKQDDFSGSNQLAALSSCTPVIDSLAKSLITNLLPPNYGEETLTRRELGELFNVSHEAIRLWEENGKLIELGWERIPHIKSPVKYSRTSQPMNPAATVSPLN